MVFLNSHFRITLNVLLSDFKQGNVKAIVLIKGLYISHSNRLSSNTMISIVVAFFFISSCMDEGSGNLGVISDSESIQAQVNDGLTRVNRLIDSAELNIAYTTIDSLYVKPL